MTVGDFCLSEKISAVLCFDHHDLIAADNRDRLLIAFIQRLQRKLYIADFLRLLLAGFDKFVVNDACILKRIKEAVQIELLLRIPPNSAPPAGWGA